jgi:hypothetical protein
MLAASITGSELYQIAAELTNILKDYKSYLRGFLSINQTH